jgi:hypothetical protein
MEGKITRYGRESQLPVDPLSFDDVLWDCPRSSISFPGTWLKKEGSDYI